MMFKIAHISDLHFGKPFDKNLWNYVKSIITSEAPTILIVSGDVANNPWPFLLLQAKRELEDLAHACNAELFVVPGNHDVAVMGSFRLPLFSKFFRAIFYTDTGGLIKKIPAFADSSTIFGSVLLNIRRLAFYARLPWLLITRKLYDPGHEAVAKELMQSKTWGLLVGFDSNYKGKLATGSIRDGDIYRVSSWVAENEKKEWGFWSAVALRIGVLHHHPLPIPYSVVKESATSYEPFLVLRNAGTLLRELAAHSFDLILHGHKHFHNFSRISFLRSNRDAEELGVLATGSTSVRLGEAGRNSLNLISLKQNGRVKITCYFVGGGSTPRAGPPSSTVSTFFLDAISDLKKRNFRRALELQEIECVLREMEIAVDDFGTSVSIHRIKGLRVYRNYTTDCRPVQVGVDKGRLVEHSIMLEEGDKQKGFDFEYQGSKDGKTHNYLVKFNKNLIGHGESVDYGITYRTRNCYILTEWEADERGFPRLEKTWVAVNYPTRKLRITLKLPERLASVRPYLLCCLPSSYPKLDLDNYRGATPKETEPKWIVDSEMTEFEAGALRQVERCKWILEVDFPLIGYCYEICWSLSGIGAKGQNVLVAGQTEECRRILLQHRESRKRGGNGEQVKRVNEILGVLLENIKKRYSSGFPEEKISITLMAYDSKSKELVVVDGLRTWEKELRWDFKLGVGDGLAGAVFKQGRPLLYALSVLGTDPRADEYLTPATEDATDYKVMISAPLLHPKVKGKRRSLPEEIIGVINIGSDSPGSGFLRLVDLPKEEEAKEIVALQGVAQGIFESILDVYGIGKILEKKVNHMV